MKGSLLPKKGFNKYLVENRTKFPYNLILEKEGFLLQTKINRIWFILIGMIIILVMASLSLARRTRLYGDGAEYLLMTHAFATHASPDIRAEDVDDFLTLPDSDLNQLRILKDPFQKLARELRSPSPDYKWINQFGLFASREQNIHACHFWLYSLLVVPFYWLGLGLGLGPVAGFTLFHMTLLALALVYIIRLLPRHGWLAAAAFFFCGVSFYLTWTGPEILTAICVLAATLQTIRLRPGTAMLLAGLGAAQNPPLIFLFPLIIGFTLASRRWPSLAWPDSPVRKNRSSQVWPAVAGIILAGLPYLFFYITFGVPSLIARHFTDISLATPSRLHSLFFDLNQGMTLGVPGLLLIWITGLVWSMASSRNRRRVWLPTGMFLITMLVMAFSTLPATNWNAGSRVMIRYAFWLAMPLLGLLFFYLTILPERIGRWLQIGLIALQLVPVMTFGLLGQHYNYLSLTPPASWVLAHHPDWYNPEPEILMERVIGSEGALRSHPILVYPQVGTPTKVLRQWNNWDSQGGLCSEGAYLSGRRVHERHNGWEYHHPPFECIPFDQLNREGFWNFARAYSGHDSLLGKGWTIQQKHGVWTEGFLSELNIPVPEGMRPGRIHFSGRYSGKQRFSRVSINGRDAGRHALINGIVEIPESLRSSRELAITLEHPQAVSPFMLGKSKDRRLLGFFLTALRLE